MWFSILFLRLAIYHRGSRHSSVHELVFIMKERKQNDANRKGENMRKWRPLNKMSVCAWCILGNARSLNVRTVLQASPAARVEKRSGETLRSSLYEG